VGLNANGPATAGALAAVVVVGADETLVPPVPDAPVLDPPTVLEVAGDVGELVPLD
jgi:hypothetical protein